MQNVTTAENTNSYVFADLFNLYNSKICFEGVIQWSSMQLLAVCTLDLSTAELPFDYWSTCCSDVGKSKTGDVKQKRLGWIYNTRKRGESIAWTQKNPEGLKGLFHRGTR